MKMDKVAGSGNDEKFRHYSVRREIEWFYDKLKKKE